jgi:threonylcarbamoyladenosine tRNA methylthiotransferase MtaB
MSLGCKVNRYEIDDIAAKLAKFGVSPSDDLKKSDIIVINTCSVTNISDKKSRQLIRRAQKENPDTFLVVTGCYVNSRSDLVSKMGYVDLVVPNQNKGNIAQLIAQKVGLKRTSKSGTLKKRRTRDLLKVVDGCEAFCSYCSIPYLRGQVKSRALSDISGELSALIGENVKEIVLTGINLGKYGQDTKSKNLSLLIKNLAEYANGKARIRLSSIEMNDVSEDIVDLIKKNYICKHLHIPLQSGSDKILRLMNRSYSAEEFLDKIAEIKKAVSDIAITTDIMVGFPGETDDDFDETVKTVKSAGFSRVHVFKYSPRENTPAAAMPGQIEELIKHKRSSYLIAEHKKITRDYARKFLNQHVDILMEGQACLDGKSYAYGLSSNYLKVHTPIQNGLAGQLVKVKINEIRESNIFGELIIGNRKLGTEN